MANEMEALAKSVFDSMQGYVSDRFKAFEASMAETFRKMVDALPRPKDGIDGKDGAPGINGKDGAPGKDADAEAIGKKAMDVVLKFLDEVPIPKDGAPGLKGDTGDKGESGKDGKDGAKGDPGEPGPAGADGAPGMPGANGERGLAGENGKDGAPGADGLKGDPGLNGKDGAPGIQGKDGAPGINGKDADPELILRMVKDATALVPKPRDGIDGKSVTLDEVMERLKPLLEGEVSRWELEGERRAMDVLQRAIDRMPRPKDGLGFDDMTVEDVDERTIALVFTRGDETKRFEKSWPVVIDRGTYKSGDTYEHGDALTYGGSLFIAQRKTLATEKPEDGSGAFRLAVKRGRDGS